MKKLLWLGSLASLLIPVQAVAQSAFDGTWKIDPSKTQLPTKPEVYLLQDGIYHCPACNPPIGFQADGQDHNFTGDPCYDTVSVKVADERTVEETDKRKGKTVATSRMSVSPNGDTFTIDWSERCNAKGDVVSGRKIMTRVAKGPEGSHAISGSWRYSKQEGLSENALVATLKLEGDTFSFSDPTGQGYTAKLDGTETPMEGDLSNTTVSVKRIDENTIEETDKLDGKVVQILRFAVSSDGKTVTVSMEDKISGDTRQFVLEKQ